MYYTASLLLVIVEQPSKTDIKPLFLQHPMFAGKRFKRIAYELVNLFAGFFNVFARHVMIQSNNGCNTLK